MLRPGLARSGALSESEKGAMEGLTEDMYEAFMALVAEACLTRVSPA